MTTPISPLPVEKTARAICKASGANPDEPVYRNGNPESGILYLKWSLYRAEATAAIAACHAEEMRLLLQRLDAASTGDGRTFEEEELYAVWREARVLLAKLDVDR